MIHRGDLINIGVKKSGWTLSDLAEKLQISRTTLYNWSKEENLSREKLNEIGNVLDFDFKPYLENAMVKEPEAEYGKTKVKKTLRITIEVENEHGLFIPANFEDRVQKIFKGE